MPQTIAKELRPSTLIGRHTEEELLPSGKASPGVIIQLKKEMQEHVKRLEFEEAARVRDLIKRLGQK